MVGSKCNLKSGVSLLPTNRSPQTAVLTISQLKGNFNGLCLQKETRYTLPGKRVDNHKGSATSYQNVMNFDPLKFHHIHRYNCHLSSSFFFRQLPAELLNGTQPYPATRLEVSAIWKCMSEMWGIPSCYKSGAPRYLFRRLTKSKFNGLYLQKETRYKRTRADTCVGNYNGLLHRLKTTWTMNFCPQTASNWKWVFTHPP